jgi:hypothetical protein
MYMHDVYSILPQVTRDTLRATEGKSDMYKVI